MSTKKMLYLLLTMFTISLFIVSIQRAHGQTEERMETQKTYTEIQYHLYQQEFSQAQQLIQNLLTEDAHAHVYYLSATIEKELGHTELAAKYMYQVLKIDPHYVDQPDFMLDFLEILISIEEFDKASAILERCMAFSKKKTTTVYQQRLTEISALLQQGDY